MKKSIIILMLIAILVMAIPASAAGREPVGAKLSIIEGDEKNFPAGEPFHISHGWLWNPKEGAVGKLDFELEIDGLLYDQDFRLISADPSVDPEFLLLKWVHNFPEGMTGEHTFTGHWYAPCQWVYGKENCPNPNEKVESFTNTVVVTFIE